jgi:hypothetical protein
VLHGEVGACDHSKTKGNLSVVGAKPSVKYSTPKDLNFDFSDPLSSSVILTILQLS